MNKQVSLYLDCARFLAAFSVMLCHFSDIFFRGLLPFFIHMGAEGVGVFFVLSGFVIGYVTDAKERDLRTYAINRAARIYSVVIPCLAACFVLDTFGRYSMPEYYALSWPHLNSLRHEIFDTLFSLGFVDDLWFSYWFPGSDSPFWSLCYEVPYYFIFGAARFLSGRRRRRVITVACLFFGPAIMALFPLWLSGYFTYRWVTRLRLSTTSGRLIFLAATGFWAVSEILRWKFGIGVGKCRGILSPEGWQYYAAGLPFAASIIGVRYSGLMLPGRFARLMRRLSGATFTLYLLHYPLARFLDGLLPQGWSDLESCAALILLILAIVLIFAEFTERRKEPWRRWIEAGFEAIAGFRVSPKTLLPGDG